MKKLLHAISAASVIGLGTMTVLPSPASAHEAGSASCSSGALCAWVDTHYLGGRYQFFGTNSSWNSWPDISDDMSAARNAGTSGLRARVFQDANYSGGIAVCLTQGSQVAHTPVNDQSNSNDWQSFC